MIEPRNIGARRSLGPLLLAALIVAATAAHAQQPPAPPLILIGPAAGMEVGIQRARVPVFAGSVDCGLFTGGDGVTPWAGARLLLPAFFGTRFGLGVDLHGASDNERFTAAPVGLQPATDPETGALIELQHEYRLTSSSRMIRLDLRGLYPLFPNARLSLGPSIGYRFGGTFTELDHVLGPGNIRFAGGQSELPITDGPLLSTRPLALGAVAGISYDLFPWPRRRLSTELTLRTDLLSPARQAIWQTYALGLGLALLFDATPAQHPMAAEIPTPAPPQPPHPKLAATIDLYGVDEHEHRLPAAVVHVYEVFYRQHAPFLPAIFFARGSTELPKRYAALSAADTSRFANDSLAGLGLLQTYYQSLNVLGARLKEHGPASITLVGTTSRDEPPALAAIRAQRVKEYLVDTWGIPPSQLEVREGNGAMSRSNEATEDGRAENRRVEIASSSPAIIAPIVTDRIVRDFDPPQLRMDPVIDAEAGIRSWTITVSQEGKVLARYSSADENGEQPELTWRLINDRVDSVLSPIVAELTVTDSAGGTITAHGQIPLLLERKIRVVDKRIDATGERQRISYTLVAFGYNSPDLGRHNEAVVEEIAASALPGARITITGYTDRIGDEQYNAGLSRLRAEHVAEALRVALARRGTGDVTISLKGAGVETERFENDLPEGRILSRGVSVIVERDASGPQPKR